MQLRVLSEKILSEESPGPIEQEQRLTAAEGDLRESATENYRRLYIGKDGKAR